MVRHTRSSAKKQASKEADSNNKQESSEASASNKDASKDQNSPRLSEDSSSESDIENYLKPVNEIDLTSSFFDIPKPEKQFQDIEKNIFSGVRKLSDSESEDDLVLDNKEKEAAMEIQKATVEKIQDYMKRIEEAKQHVEEYEAKKQSQKKKTRKKLKTDEAPNIADLLSVGEKLSKDETNSASLGSEDFTSMSESEREDWEEVKEAKEKNIIPKETVQITVQMPGVIRQKKGLDLIAAMKRRLNRIKKENQVLIHKVHLLCWIAHGNHVNVTINDEKLMGLALSLIPSEHCYPSDRTDLNYLEQILSWYRKTMQHLDQREDKNFDIKRQLHIDMSKKQASNKKILVYIFICILRSLGIHCRLVMSLLVEPLRPPSSELCSLSTKKEVKKNAEKETTKEENETKLNDYTKEAVRGSKRKTSDKVKEEKAKNVNKKESADHKKQVKPSERKTGNKKEEIAKSPDKKVPKRESQTETMQALKKKSVPEKKPNTSSQNKEKHESKKPIQQSAKANTNKQNKEKGKTANKTKPNLLKIKMLRLNKPSKTSESKDVQTTSQQVPQLDGANDSADEASTSAKKPNLKKIKEKKVEPDCPHRTHVRRLKSLPQYTEGDSEEEFAPRSPFSRKNSQDKKIDLSKLSVKRKSVRFSLKRSTSASPRKMDVRDDIINLVKGRISEQKEKDKMKLVKNRKVRQDDDDDSDYSPEPIKKKKHESDDEFIESLKPKVKKRVQVKQENDEVEKKRRGNDVWIEVYLETEEKWISVDVVRQQVHCVNEIFVSCLLWCIMYKIFYVFQKRASQPVCYILAWDNKNYIKDITSRYCPNWNTVTRKLRVDPKWWEQTLKAFAGPKSARDREEDEELARLQLEKPLPTTISEYELKEIAWIRILKNLLLGTKIIRYTH